MTVVIMIAIFLLLVVVVPFTSGALRKQLTDSRNSLSKVALGAVIGLLVVGLLIVPDIIQSNIYEPESNGQNKSWIEMNLEECEFNGGIWVGRACAPPEEAP